MNIMEGRPLVGGAGARPRLVSTLVPLGVLSAMALVVAWSAWPIVRPAREVTVVQAVFDREEPSDVGAEAAPQARPGPTVQAPGWLEAEPFVVACTALADGVVERMEVLEGEFVEAGAVVARLVSEDSALRVRRAEAELMHARAALAVAQAEREAAESMWREPVELERAVWSSRAALAEQEAELAQLPSLIASARATLTRLEEETSRVRQSIGKGAATEFELIVAEQREASQRAEVAALEARGPMLGAGVERLRAELRAAERNFTLRIEDRRRVSSAEAGVSTAEAAVARAEAMRDEAALELERMTIRAPISGFVQRRLKAPGDKVIRMMDDPFSAHLVHLYDPEQLRVRVDVPLADASSIYVGQRAEVVVEVLPDRVFAGEVLRITHEADLQKNTLEIQVRVVDPDPILRPEMLTRVKFLPRDGGGTGRGTAAGSASVLVPDAAVQVEGDRARVWLVTDRRNGRGVLRSREVRVIAREGGWARVAGAVQPGDLLTMGLDAPLEGERVVVGTDGRASGEEPS